METLDENRSINQKAKIQFLLNDHSKDIIRNILKSSKFQALKIKLKITLI